jgi:acetyl/propionyl-CoA carboxylase alpha subunit
MLLPEATRAAILSDSLRLMSAAKYKNAGTVEFLVDKYVHTLTLIFMLLRAQTVQYMRALI